MTAQPDHHTEGRLMTEQNHTPEQVPVAKLSRGRLFTGYAVLLLGVSMMFSSFLQIMEYAAQ